MNDPVLKCETHIFFDSVPAPKYPLIHVYLSGIFGAILYFFLYGTHSESFIFIPFIIISIELKKLSRRKNICDTIRTIYEKNGIIVHKERLKFEFEKVYAKIIPILFFDYLIIFFYYMLLSLIVGYFYV